MRLWSIHPCYLDRKGLLAVWREALLAQSVLLKGKYSNCKMCKTNKEINNHYNTNIICLKCNGTGKTKTPYFNHPQLERFKQCEKPIEAIGHYLITLCQEADNRGYYFDISKIKHRGGLRHDKLIVTTSQLEYEFKHLQNKLLSPIYNKKTGELVRKHRDETKYLVNQSYKNERLSGLQDRCYLTYVEQNPLFEVIEGGIAVWEKAK